MEIDPLEAVITWLETALTTVSGRVAGKHRYGDGAGDWADDATGVSVHLDGGVPDLYAPIGVSRLEIRIYSNDQAAIVNVWMELVGLSRNNQRFVQATTRGDALIHYFLPGSILSLIYDDPLRKELGIVFFESMISEVVIP
jgi:hypothetical protein